MGAREHDIPREVLPRLKDVLNRTLAAYEKSSELREQKIEQDLEQVKVYLNVLENQSDEIKLSPRMSKKLEELFSWEPRAKRKNASHRRQQDQLEDHFIEIQKVLVALISKRYKY